MCISGYCERGQSVCSPNLKQLCPEPNHEKKQTNDGVECVEKQCICKDTGFCDEGNLDVCVSCEQGFMISSDKSKCIEYVHQGTAGCNCHNGRCEYGQSGCSADLEETCYPNYEKKQTDDGVECVEKRCICEPNGHCEPTDFDKCAGCSSDPDKDSWYSLGTNTCDKYEPCTDCEKCIIGEDFVCNNGVNEELLREFNADGVDYEPTAEDCQFQCMVEEGCNVWVWVQDWKKCHLKKMTTVDKELIKFTSTLKTLCAKYPHNLHDTLLSGHFADNSNGETLKFCKIPELDSDKKKFLS